MSSKPKVIAGEVFCDARGRIASLNTFHFEDVRRMYVVHHPDTTVVRGWDGHRFERKWFFCSAGAFRVSLVEIDNWETPSKDLKPSFYDLEEGTSALLCVPAGYANCFKATQPGSTLVIFSDKTVEESVADSYRFDKDTWFQWSEQV
jgi:dTDP-4-dehydrorhamnose 3,5-epimerase